MTHVGDWSSNLPEIKISNECNGKCLVASIIILHECDVVNLFTLPTNFRVYVLKYLKEVSFDHKCYILFLLNQK